MREQLGLELPLAAPPVPGAPPPLFVPTPAPPLWGPDGTLLLPDRVRLISLWLPYAWLVFGDNGEPGRKGLETRTWEWPYEPGWLAIYGTKGPDRAAYRRIYGTGWQDALAQHRHLGAEGAIIGVVWIGGCRPMRREDVAAACIDFDPARFVWVIGASHRLENPIRLRRGPQKFASCSRDAIAVALGRRREGGRP